MKNTPEYLKQLRKKRKARGDCASCGRFPAIKGKTKCEKCRKYATEWNKRNKEKNSVRKAKSWQVNKHRVIKAYGGKCKCCGEKYIPFLVLDHIHPGGTQHRKDLKAYGRGSNFYAWLIKNDFPKGLQVLCANCNTAKGTKSKCPCRRERLR